MQPSSDSGRGQRPGRGLVRMGRVRDVPVYVASSWLVICAVLALAYGPVIHDEVDGIGSGRAYLLGVVFAVVFAACVLAHEVGHTLVATALGHRVRRIVLFGLGGVSELDGEPERPRDEVLIAAAGPLVSLVIGVGGYVGFRVLPDGGAPHVLFGLVAWTNLLIAAFNLLPGLPLDGGRVVRGLLCACRVRSVPATVVTAWFGRLVAVGAAASVVLVGHGGLDVITAIISLGLAAYLWVNAGMAIRSAKVRERLPQIELQSLVRPGLFVTPEVSVAEALRRARERGVGGVVVVDAYRRPLALVDETRAGDLPPDQAPWTPVTAVARPITDGLLLAADVDSAGLLERIRDVPANEYLVLDGAGAPAGIISTRDFARLVTGPQQRDGA